ncbi:HAD family hydrolase, partial [Streptomyces sp. NPDC096080]
SRRRLTTKSANELADAVLATKSLDWLRTALGP